MTRWARTKSAHRHEKVPSNATPWSKLKPTPEARSFKDGSNVRKPNNVVSNVGGVVKRKMPEFKGTNFERQMSEEKVKELFSVAYGGGPNQQKSKLQKRNIFTDREENNTPVSNSIKTEPKEFNKLQQYMSQKRNKFQNMVKREVSTENSKSVNFNFVKIEPKKVNSSQQDLSAKRKRKQNKFKKGKLTTEIQGTGTTGGDISKKHFIKEEKMTNNSLLLVKQEPTDLSMQSKDKKSWKGAKKEASLSQTKNMANISNVVGLQSNRTELGTDSRTKKKKRNRKKRQELYIQSTGATDSSKNSDGPIKSELSDPESNKSEVSNSTLASKKKKNKLKEKKKRKKKLALSVAQSTSATESSKNLGSAVKSELGVQEADDQKQIDKEQKKNMHRLKLLAKRKEKGITMLSDKAEKKLYSIRKALKKRGKMPEEIKTILRKERRIAELKFRKAQNTVCYRCRMPGHTVATCTTILEDSEQSMGVCFRCGSTEHILRRCPVSKTDGLPFAKCFICQSRGHLSSACPKNDFGIFPRGGACLLCKSVNHLKKDCPTLVKAEEEDEPSVAYRATEFGSADAEISDEDKVPAEKKAKVVTF